MKMELAYRLRELRRKNKALIAAHRGASGGNIIFNTIAAYENALRHGADIVEMDAARTTDGVFYTFHDGTEPVVLGTTRNIRGMDSSYVDQLFLRNPSFEATHERVNRLSNVFTRLKDRCIINVDRSWFYWEDIIALIRKMGMEGQVILKSPPEEKYLDILQSIAPDIAYMPILRRPEEADLVKKYRINCIMAELIFSDIDNPIVDDAFIKELKAQGLFLWVNVITLNEWLILSGGKDDYHAIMDSMDDNWGWCLAKGFDVLQTDWPLLLRAYLEKS
jgi:glycerophosphoryl diester phosphodiesterase